MLQPNVSDPGPERPKSNKGRPTSAAITSCEGLIEALVVVRDDATEFERLCGTAVRIAGACDRHASAMRGLGYETVAIEFERTGALAIQIARACLGRAARLREAAIPEIERCYALAESATVAGAAAA